MLLVLYFFPKNEVHRWNNQVLASFPPGVSLNPSRTVKDSVNVGCTLGFVFHCLSCLARHTKKKFTYYVGCVESSISYIFRQVAQARPSSSTTNIWRLIICLISAKGIQDSLILLPSCQRAFHLKQQISCKKNPVPGQNYGPT